MIYKHTKSWDCMDSLRDMEYLNNDGLSPTESDVIGSLGSSHKVIEFYQETGARAFWNPYLFRKCQFIIAQRQNKLPLIKN